VHAGLWERVLPRSPTPSRLTGDSDCNQDPVAGVNQSGEVRKSAVHFTRSALLVLEEDECRSHRRRLDLDSVRPLVHTKDAFSASGETFAVRAARTRAVKAVALPHRMHVRMQVLSPLTRTPR
jgi:hypothetical protein